MQWACTTHASNLISASALRAVALQIGFWFTMACTQVTPLGTLEALGKHGKTTALENFESRLAKAAVHAAHHKSPQT
jgi:hypothetical protein